jgi:hypothetical protein
MSVTAWDGQIFGIDITDSFRCLRRGSFFLSGGPAINHQQKVRFKRSLIFYVNIFYRGTKIKKWFLACIKMELLKW